jgi:hypothetical protein
MKRHFLEHQNEKSECTTTITRLAQKFKTRYLLFKINPALNTETEL